MTGPRAIFPKGRPHGLQNQAGGDPQFSGMLRSIFQQYPALARHQNDYAVIQGRPMLPGDGRQLESYPPDESWNPIPGKATTELFNTTVPVAEQQTMVAGDFLHHLRRVDPQWAAMKADVVPKDMNENRADEFLMGYLTPDRADEWSAHYTPEQRKKLGKMAEYLMRGSTAPGYR